MDSLTHTVLGACFGEVIAGRKIGKKALLWGAIANNLGDFDVVTALWMNQPGALLAHRGFTHSLVFLLIVAPLIAWWFWKKKPASSMTYKDWLVLWGGSMFIHLSIDAFNAYGTGWFEPFSHYRFAFNILFVADPFYSISLLIATIALLILKRSNPHRLKWAKAGLLISSLYLVYAFYNKVKVDAVVKDNIREQSISARSYFSTPTPLNNFLWYIVANTDKGYLIAYHSVFDQNQFLPFTFYQRQDSLLDAFRENEEVKKLIRFSAGYYTLELINDSLKFNDLRFGQIGGWDSQPAPFVFNYTLNRNVNNKALIQQGRLKASSGQAISSMLERIKGN